MSGLLFSLKGWLPSLMFWQGFRLWVEFRTALQGPGCEWGSAQQHKRHGLQGGGVTDF